MSEQQDWDALRLALFFEVASIRFDGDEELQATWQRCRVAISRAFDRPLPAYPVYRQLRTFTVARWPILKQIVTSKVSNAENNNERISVIEEVITVLDHALAERQRGNAHRLEVEMELLRELLKAPH